MERNESKLKLWAKIFIILACAVLIAGNALAVIPTFFARYDVSYTAETIMSGLTSPSRFGSALTSLAPLALAAGIGDIISIILTSFSISFLPKSSDAPRALKILAVTLLTVSILALLSILPVYSYISSLIGI